jgi:uncharacterized phiE125 gp8 family phage protein
MKYTISVESTTLPLTVEEVKTHLRIDDYVQHDDMIRSYIEATSKTIEQRANLMLTAQTWKLFLEPDEVVENIFWYKYPVTSVSSIKYYDSDNSLQTLSTDDYTVITSLRPAQIIIDDVPSVYDRTDAMEITFVGGYSSLPNDISLAIKQRCYNVYNNPSDSVEQKMTLLEKVIRDYRSYEK